MLKPPAWKVLGILASLLLVAMACSQAEPAPVSDQDLVSPAGTDAPPPVTAAPPSSGAAAIAIAAATAAAPRPSPPSPAAGPATATMAPAAGSVTPATVPSPTQAVAARPVALPSLIPEEDTLIQLIDPLDEPEYYCADVPGFGSSLDTDGPLQAHTCKPGADDELFRINHPSVGRLSMPAYDLCAEAEGDRLYTRPCSGAPAQNFRFLPDGTVRTGDGQLCLAIAPGEGEPAGGPSHLRRDLLLAACAGGQRHLARWVLPGSSPTAEAHYATQLIYDALDGALSADPWPVAKLGDQGDPSYIPVLVELMRFPWWRIGRDVEEAIFDSLDRIAEANPGKADTDTGTGADEWARWVVWLGKHPEVWPPPGFAGWKGWLYAELVDPEMGAFLYDGMRANIRVEEIVWGGVAKDGIPDLTDAPVIDGAVAEYLDPEDRVFGVSFNGEHRAYPHRIINAHEMANDVVGGVPFALAY